MLHTTKQVYNGENPPNTPVLGFYQRVLNFFANEPGAAISITAISIFLGGIGVWFFGIATRGTLTASQPLFRELMDSNLSFGRELGKVEKKLENRIDGIENRINNRIDGIENRIDNLEGRMDARFDKLEKLIKP
jgi:flagellar capping protein FliD